MKVLRSPFVFSALVLGYIFLCAPLLSVIIASFNQSGSAGTWSGFSLKWYRALFSNTLLLDATLTSLKIATLSASMAVILGTLCAVIIVRLSTYHGKRVLGVLSTAPLVMPEVIIGLSLLILFVTSENLLGWPRGRGINTITIAHTTVALAYVTVMVRTRLQEVDPALEEAALDLGARPSKVFFLVTIPTILPAILSGWLLAFALSLEDLVISSFTSGPGASTLPMVIFSSIRLGNTQQVNALATLLVCFVMVGIMVWGLFMYRKLKKNRF